jgi:hydroxymethylpyrimidine pyrophosphatase-like HAD family hydrolase
MVSCASAPGKALHATVEHLELEFNPYTDLGVGWLDVAGPGVTKASALEALREKYAVSRENTVVVGDDFNDLPMFAWAGTAIAMGHAPDEVKAAADHVTGTIAEDGVASVLEALTSSRALAGHGG